MTLFSDSATDVATVSNFREVVVTHYHLDLDVYFDRKEIAGAVKVDFKCCKDSGVVQLDIHETLTVKTVQLSDGDKKTDLQFEKKPFTGYGSELQVKLNTTMKTGDTFSLVISYVTGDGPGVVWLDPEQTAGKKKPYFYTQGQAVLNRSFFPCQDTPAIKSTYSANVKVPDGFTAVMSTSQRKEPGNVPNMSGETDNVYFNLPFAIPAYLVALAVGDLQSAKIGPRSRVWTEPCILERARAEFDGVVEDFIQTGEKLFGPYVWETYDILVMPPSFPFGGMENPCLTFVTPCLLVGDKSLTDVVIHEISHSWFGNLVTNANWSEFWLNEGFTMFAQRRIMDKLFGTAYTCLEAETGLALLRQHMDDSGEEHPLNRLRVIIEPGVDPDDTYNETPYEKGYCFVSYLQHLVGDVDKFDNFLKSYVKKFQFKSLVAEDTLEFFFESFPELKNEQVDKKEGFEFDKWLNTPGWPPYVPDLSAGKELTKPAEELANYWAGEIKAGGDTDITKWKTYQVLHFLDKVLEKASVPDSSIKKMVEQYPAISQTHNAEVRLRWSQINIKNNYTQDIPNIRAFLISQGKQKYTLPVYKALMKSSDEMKKFAKDVYEETKSMLHVNVRNYVEEILQR